MEKRRRETEADLRRLKKSDEHKALVAGLVKACHSVPNRWVSEQLRTGDPATVSRSIRLYRDPPAHLRSMARRLESGKIQNPEPGPFFREG